MSRMCRDKASSVYLDRTRRLSYIVCGRWWNEALVTICRWDNAKPRVKQGGKFLPTACNCRGRKGHFGGNENVCAPFGILQLLESGFSLVHGLLLLSSTAWGRCFFFVFSLCGKLPLSSRDGRLLHVPSLDNLTPDVVSIWAE